MHLLSPQLRIPESAGQSVRASPRRLLVWAASPAETAGWVWARHPLYNVALYGSRGTETAAGTAGPQARRQGFFSLGASSACAAHGRPGKPVRQPAVAVPRRVGGLTSLGSAQRSSCSARLRAAPSGCGLVFSWESLPVFRAHCIYFWLTYDRSTCGKFYSERGNFK